MAGLVPAIHAFLPVTKQNVDHRDKPGDDAEWNGDGCAKQSFVASPGDDDFLVLLPLVLNFLTSTKEPP